MACPSFTAMVFWCGGGLFSAPGKGWQNWQKTIFNRISEGTLDTFLVRFRGVSEGCFQLPDGSTNGEKGWQYWQKTIFNRVVRRDVRQFFGAISWRVRPSLPWCFGVAEGCFQHRRQYNGKRLAKLAKRTMF